MVFETDEELLWAPCPAAPWLQRAPLLPSLPSPTVLLWLAHTRPRALLEGAQGWALGQGWDCRLWSAVETPIKALFIRRRV